MKRLKGPELKMPEVKVPQAVADLYYDLRDRRLLPIVALVVVATLAVPFLLGDSEEPLPPPNAPAEAAEAARLEIAEDSGLTVVQAKPPLRDYRKRLHGTPTDPFKQRYTGLPEDVQLEASQTTSSTTELETGSGGEVTVSPEGTSAPSTPNAGTGGGGASEPDDLDGKRLYGFRPDVRFGLAGSGDLTLHDDLPLGSLLPKQNAVVLFIGVTQNGERALFSIAREILVRGEGGCVGGNENCRFLSMREGDAVDLVTGIPGKSYRLKVESIDFVELDLPPKSERAEGSSATGARAGMTPGLPQNFSN